MNRDQLADWLHCLSGGMYDWVVDEIKKELAKPEQEFVNIHCPSCLHSFSIVPVAKPEQEFYPDWDMLKPYHERIKELEAQLAQPEQEPCKCIDQFWCATFDRCKRNE